jgi:AraC-like DNA-binding protein
MAETVQTAKTPLMVSFDARSPLLARAEDHESGSRIPWHQHDLSQLIHAAEGVMTVETDDGLWVVPPERAVWVPAFEGHAIRMTGAVALRSLYLEPSLRPISEDRCCVVQVSAILQAAILRAIDFELPYAEHGSEARLVAVILDEIKAAPTAPLHLPKPTDPRALRVAVAFQTNLADRRTIAGWAKYAGASARTLERLFRDEVGVTFGSWQRQARLLRALEVMAAGQSVTAAALEVGFETPSAFIAMFRRAMGTTPAKYFRGHSA